MGLWFGGGVQLGWRGRCSHGAVFPTEACSELVQKTDVIFLRNNAMNKVLKKKTKKEEKPTRVCGVFVVEPPVFLASGI